MKRLIVGVLLISDIGYCEPALPVNIARPTTDEMPPKLPYGVIYAKEPNWQDLVHVDSDIIKAFEDSVSWHPNLVEIQILRELQKHK